jgi:hypothetical protein
VVWRSDTHGMTHRGAIGLTLDGIPVLLAARRAVAGSSSSRLAVRRQPREEAQIAATNLRSVQRSKLFTRTGQRQCLSIVTLRLQWAQHCNVMEGTSVEKCRAARVGPTRVQCDRRFASLLATLAHSLRGDRGTRWQELPSATINVAARPERIHNVDSISPSV